jgi:protein-tyrosine phosphatase
MIQVLMVCMGNICRSPLAEGTFQALIEAYGLQQQLRVESAGTHFYHIGCLPDERSIAKAAEYGLDITHQRARQLCAEDFDTFEYILVMDKRNLRDAASLAATPQAAKKLQLFLNYAREPHTEMEVPDPYHDGPAGFEHVYQLVKSASEGLMAHILEQHPSLGSLVQEASTRATSQPI